jgi:hypothetical protein
MSSVTSTDRAIGGNRTASIAANAREAREANAAFKPWQFFLLAGMLAATATVVVATGQSPAAIVLLSLTIVSAAFVGLAVYRSLVPFVHPEAIETPTMLAGRTRAALEREKTLVLRAIKELEFDYAMKKVAKADYDEMVGRLRARAIRLMRQLDAGEGYRLAIEKELQSRLVHAGGGAAAPAAQAPGAAASLVAPRGEAREEPTKAAAPAGVARTCACGTSNDPDARFCKNCGERLAS